MGKKKIIWIYERKENKIYRRPQGKLSPKQLIILNQPVYNN